MGTRSAIGVQQEDGSVLAVYCHWDGYPEYNGKILKDHYNYDKAMQLIKLGDLSSLGANIGTKHDFHTQVEGECTFYKRDRGEKDVKARSFDNEEAFFNEFSSGVEYWYLLLNDVVNDDWYVRGYRSKDWKLVSEVLAFEEEEA